MSTWVVQVEEKRRYNSVTGEPVDERHVWIRDESGSSIALMCSPREDIGRAHMMAAAREMYAALKTASKALNKLHGASMTSADTAYPALQEVDAALALADDQEHEEQAS